MTTTDSGTNFDKMAFRLCISGMFTFLLVIYMCLEYSRLNTKAYLEEGYEYKNVNGTFLWVKPENKRLD